MNLAQITASIQSQLTTQDQDTIDFYYGLISSLPQTEEIQDFLICINTSGNNLRPSSNLTIITYSDDIDEDLIAEHLEESQYFHDIMGFNWVSDQLIIALNY